KAQVIARTIDDRETQLVEEYQGVGLTRKQAEQRVYKKLRGSEAPACATVRMTEKRYVNRVKRLNQDLTTPVQSEPLSYTLTMLYRAVLDDDDTAVRDPAVSVR